MHHQQQQWSTQAVLPASTTPVSGQQAPQWPKEIPFPPSEENIDRLQDWLLQHFSGTMFNIERHPLPIMEGKPLHIHLKEDTEPYVCNTPADVAKYCEADVKQQLDKDVDQDVIEKVPQGEPTNWYARMVVAAKPNGKPRRAVDFQKLNSNCLRKTHYTPTPFNLVSGIPNTPTKLWRTPIVVFINQNWMKVVAN